MNYKSDFLNALAERGLLHQCSSFDNLDNILNTTKIKGYIGFDCTARSLHIGSLLQIILLKYLQKYGHTPVAVLGGGTTLVGDPTGKDTSRSMLSLEDIQNNLNGIKSVLEKFISFSGENKALLINNADWLCKFNYLEFLRDFGKEFTINRMLSFDSVKIRLERESPLSFLEFNYMLLQAVDYYYLNKNYGVTLQLGGSDQWGNIINGVELIRRMLQKEVFALTSPLVTTSNGTKMGKTAQGAVWLSEDMFSTWDFYQFFRNTDDLDVIKYLKLFTDLPILEIDKLSKFTGQNVNEVKKILAFEITKFCHGEEQAIINQNIAINTFEKGYLDSNLPTFFISLSSLTEEKQLVNILHQFGIIASNSEGRKLIQNGGIKINDNKCDNPNYTLSVQDIIKDIIKISIGKKRHIILKIQN